MAGPWGLPNPIPQTPKERRRAFTVEDFQPAVTVAPIPLLGKRTRNGETYTPAEGTGRVTTKSSSAYRHPDGNHHPSNNPHRIHQGGSARG